MRKILFLMTAAVLLKAQMPMGMPPEMENREIENFRTYKLTEYMELNTDQSEKFFPRLRDHRQGVHKVHMEMHGLGIALEQEDGMIRKDLTSDELQVLLDRLSVYEDEELKLRREFIEDMRTYLEPYQVARYLYFEHKFRKQLQQSMRDKWNNKNRRR